MDKCVLNVPIFDIFNKDWSLLTAGSMEAYNCMTISWGQMGSLWGMPGKAKNIVTVFVKPIRHTYSYMEKSEYFTLCWFPKEYRKDLGILGSLSGRDGNKLAKTRLTPKQFSFGVGYEEATRTLLCKKIYVDQLRLEQIPQDAAQVFYTDEEPHYFYIGEVVEVEEKKS